MADAGLVVQTVFRAGEHGYAGFRIPAVVAHPQGLLAFAEGRRDGLGDAGDIDLVVRCSTDGGASWDRFTVVCAGAGATVGNPVPIVVPRTAAVVLLFTCSDGGTSETDIRSDRDGAGTGRRVLATTSRDGGRQWSAPLELSAQAKASEWRWYATGPGHGIALGQGPHAGRLVAPGNHSRPPDRAGQAGTDPALYGGHALLSDDDGASWRIGFCDDRRDGAVNANESTMAELPDGRIYVNARNQHGTGPGHRVHGWSDDGGLSLIKPLAPVALAGPEVQGSVLAPAEAGSSLLYSDPDHPDERRGLVIRASSDGGCRWLWRAQVTAAPAAYSDLVDLGWPSVGVLFETGVAGPYERIDFARVPMR